MKPCVQFAVLAASALSLLSAGSARAVVILDTDFEPPTYTLGSVHGQDNWVSSVGGPHLVSNAIVHSGTQSLNAVRDTREFDADWSTLGGNFIAETWCYTQPMAGSLASHFSIGNGLNEHFWIELRGDGQLTFYMSSTVEVRTLGTAALNKWLLFKAEYVAHPYFVRLSVTGDGVNESWVGGMIAAGAPSFVYVGTNNAVNLAAGEGPYWDDVRVANEPTTPAVPKSWGSLKGLYR